MKFLVVDDNDANLYMLQLLLESHGHQVTLTSNGQEALDKARQNPPDMIVSDILMPVMDGFTLCRHWKQDANLKSIPFVFYTATYTDPKDEEFALNLGAERFIIKPAEPDVLIKILDEVIAEYESNQLVAAREPVEEEVVYLREYNETLIRKLEEKVTTLESTVQTLNATIETLQATEASLRESKARLQEAQRIAMVGDWVWDIVENTLHWSDEVYRIFGLVPQEFEATYETFLERIHPSDRDAVQQAVDDSLNAFAPYDIEHRIVQPNGSERIIHEYGEVTFDEDSKPLRMIGTVHDITERKKAEIALYEKEKLRIELEKERDLSELKSRFIAITSHEFRTPLSTIQTSAEILYNYYTRLDDSKREQQFDRINSQIQHLVQLLENVLTISRSEAGMLQANLTSLDLGKLSEDIVEAFQSSENTKHQLSYSQEGDCTKILVDRQHIQQIFNNLLSNAIKYSKAGSTIHIHLSCDSETINLSVADEGIGISKEDQAQLFTPFHRAANVIGRVNGTGLGLSIVKSIAESYGGTVGCESVLGEGSTFIVVLPTQIPDDN